MAERLYAQYADKPKTVEWLRIVDGIATQLFDVYEDIRLSYDIDLNEGAQLDVIGRIVVLGRGFESFITYEGINWGGAQFGGLGDQFRNVEGEPGATDELYRILLRAKISKNNSIATIDDILTAINFIVPNNRPRLIDNEDMTFSIIFDNEVDPIAKLALDTFDIIPKPQGVRFLGYIDGMAVTQFGGSPDWGDSRAQFNEV